jgi:hypothetical protein
VAFCPPGPEVRVAASLTIHLSFYMEKKFISQLEDLANKNLARSGKDWQDPTKRGTPCEFLFPRSTSGFFARLVQKSGWRLSYQFVSVFLMETPAYVFICQFIRSCQREYGSIWEGLARSHKAEVGNAFQIPRGGECPGAFSIDQRFGWLPRPVVLSLWYNHRPLFGVTFQPIYKLKSAANPFFFLYYACDHGVSATKYER